MNEDLYVVMAHRDGSTYMLQAVRIEGTTGLANARITLSKPEAERMVSLLDGAFDPSEWYIAPSPVP